ncbi:MAG: preprotein translocase subunit SecG [Candidatus Berkelbacteria bacterium Licking1014_7]|uniref:Protein-export membrane protein SecG n=1 Tax=Candidatus Berkelbacteria bacterium Licking1014_7 TaxID=2017147 RepID=A0A554LHX8_9BACT|nr:MAG: preprotein translocase subunit SecG [Candidatus Berkelbacteria bacterium Licking1014_7]
MEKFISISQITLSVIIILLILIQQRGTALGGAFGGEGNVYRTRRGVEKLVFRSTIILVIVFVILAIVDLAVS